MVKLDIEHIYSKPDNLSCFVHPKFNKNFQLISIDTLINQAKEIVHILISNNIETVFFAETGASPFVFICNEVIKKQNKKIKWIPIKLPRDIPDDISPIIQYFSGEKVDLENIKLKASDHFSKNIPSLDLLLKNINQIPLNGFQESILDGLSDTSIARALQKPIIFFDEYIDSGRTIYNVMRFLQLFNPKLEYHIVSYFTKLFDTKDHSLILHSLFDLSSEEQCYDAGVYPFENRVDLIGYFYFLDQDLYQKTYVKDFIKSADLNNYQELNFWSEMEKFLSNKILLANIQKNCEIEDVSNFISENNLIHYLLYLLEKDISANSKETEFLFLLFDMYGPIWSPMPDEYHIDFLQAYKANEKLFIKSNGFSKLLGYYIESRDVIIHKIAFECEKRKDNFTQSIKNKLEEIYEL
jgi:hypothetical protein